MQDPQPTSVSEAILVSGRFLFCWVVATALQAPRNLGQKLTVSKHVWYTALDSG